MMEGDAGNLDYSSYMGGCQNCDPFLGTLNIRCRIILQRGTIILTTAHMRDDRCVGLVMRIRAALSLHCLHNGE